LSFICQSRVFSNFETLADGHLENYPKRRPGKFKWKML
jgi:hypothetical protein